MRPWPAAASGCICPAPCLGLGDCNGQPTRGETPHLGDRVDGVLRQPLVAQASAAWLHTRILLWAGYKRSQYDLTCRAEWTRRQGGKYLSRSGNVITVEGVQKVSSLVAIMQFPSENALEAFINDPDYQPYIKARQAGSITLYD